MNINKLLVSGFIGLVMIVCYGSVLNAMECSDDEGKSINSTEHETSGSISLNISRTESTNSISNPSRIEYDPENMWFDYQALFDQTKNWVLHYDFKMQELKTIPVQHTDFEQNTLAKKALFGDKVDNNIINDICEGFVPAIGDMIDKLFKYIQCEEDKYNNDDRQVMWYNFMFLLAIRVQFSYGNNAYYKKYAEIAEIYNNSNIIPSNIGREYTSLINDKQFYNVLLPLPVIFKNNEQIG